MKYKVGDRVVIRKDLELGVLYAGERIDGYPGKERFIGKTLTIRAVPDSVHPCYYMRETGSARWSDEMIERRADMTKGDLKDGMIVAYRNGGRRTVRGNGLLNENSGRIENTIALYKDDLTAYYSPEIDIVEVIQPGTTIWKREEKVKVIIDDIELLLPADKAAELKKQLGI